MRLVCSCSWRIRAITISRGEREGRKACLPASHPPPPRCRVPLLPALPLFSSGGGEGLARPLYPPTPSIIDRALAASRPRGDSSLAPALGTAAEGGSELGSERSLHREAHTAPRSRPSLGCVTPGGFSSGGRAVPEQPTPPASVAGKLRRLHSERPSERRAEAARREAAGCASSR